MRGLGPRGKLNHSEYCIYNHFYSHTTTDSRDITWHPRQKSPEMILGMISLNEIGLRQGRFRVLYVKRAPAPPTGSIPR